MPAAGAGCMRTRRPRRQVPPAIKASGQPAVFPRDGVQPDQWHGKLQAPRCFWRATTAASSSRPGHPVGRAHRHCGKKADWYPPVRKPAPANSRSNHVAGTRRTTLPLAPAAFSRRARLRRAGEGCKVALVPCVNASGDDRASPASAMVRLQPRRRGRSRRCGQRPWPPVTARGPCARATSAVRGRARHGARPSPSAWSRQGRGSL
jgi:hypothetical protein